MNTTIVKTVTFVSGDTCCSVTHCFEQMGQIPLCRGTLAGHIQQDLNVVRWL